MFRMRQLATSAVALGAAVADDDQVTPSVEGDTSESDNDEWCVDESGVVELHTSVVTPLF